MGASAGPAENRGELGHQLRRARERSKLSVETVASLLHLDPRVITALEDNDFSQLMPVYARGYLRNYARLVHLPIEPLLESYSRMADVEPPPLQIQQRNPSVGHARRSLYVLAIALSLPLFLWAANEARFQFGKLRNPQPVTDLAITSEASPPDSGASPAIPTSLATAAISPKPESTTVLPSEPAETQAASAASATASTGAKDATAASAVPSPPTPHAGTIETAPSAPTATSAAPLPSLNQPAGPGPDQITVHASADAWVTIRDRAGRRIAFETIPAGSSRTYSGEPPFKIVLGNSPATRIDFNGQPFDQSKYTVGGSARFTLDK